MTSPGFDLYQPEQLTTSVVFASPHSGRHYPGPFLRQTVLDAHQVRSSEDAYVDTLFRSAADCGAPLLAARVPRAYVDLNRAVDELDPAVIEGVRRQGHNPRVASGLGVIPRVVANGRAIYRGKLTLAEAETRLETCWRPYHDALQGLLKQAHVVFGEAILIDCHSMPREALDCVVRSGTGRPDVVLGDRFGASASSFVVNEIEAALTRAGLKVARNAPFAGAYNTQHYGRPSRRQHAIQLEIDRSLYMDERRIAPRDDFDDFQRLIAGVIIEITALGRAEPLAAE
jgi:N-formylglutamate amidohydrolase